MKEKCVTDIRNGSTELICQRFAVLVSLRNLFTGNEKGNVHQYDIRKGDDIVNFNDEAHKFQINDMQMSSDESFLITASKDKTARLFDARTLDCLKTYK